MRSPSQLLAFSLLISCGPASYSSATSHRRLDDARFIVEVGGRKVEAGLALEYTHRRATELCGPDYAIEQQTSTSTPYAIRGQNGPVYGSVHSFAVVVRCTKKSEPNEPPAAAPVEPPGWYCQAKEELAACFRNRTACERADQQFQCTRTSIDAICFSLRHVSGVIESKCFSSPSDCGIVRDQQAQTGLARVDPECTAVK